MSRKQKIIYKGREITLKSTYPVMVCSDHHKNQCRTLYKDEEGNLWCQWYGMFRKVFEKKVPSDHEPDRMVTRYFCDIDDREDKIKYQSKTTVYRYR